MNIPVIDDLVSKFSGGVTSPEMWCPALGALNRPAILLHMHPSLADETMSWPFWLKPFWLKPFLAPGSRCESAVCRLLVSPFASLSARLVDGPQRMVSAR